MNGTPNNTKEGTEPNSDATVASVNDDDSKPEDDFTFEDSHTYSIRKKKKHEKSAMYDSSRMRVNGRNNLYV